MTPEDTNKFFSEVLNYAINQLVADGAPPATAVMMTQAGEYVGCKLKFTTAKSKAEAIAAFVSELKEKKPLCAVVVVPMSVGAGRGRKRKLSLCVAFQSSDNKFVSMVNYEKKNDEFVFEPPYFCDDNEIILCGHEYFGDAFE